MEHVYTAYTKILQDKTYYFVKKLMVIPEFKDLADVVVGYGMHTDFEKACSIAGIDDAGCRKKLLAELEGHNSIPKFTEKTPVKPGKAPIQIAESVTRWLAGQGAEVLN
ncbi:MAG TPA: hypothetical protein VK484_14185 [Ferruginibacter sp.]|nr:hypothetical protein [Ferruginibacter sp.]